MKFKIEFKDIYQNINWKSLIIGAVAFVLTVNVAINYNSEILLVFSSIGLLYIGYTSQNRIQGMVLGAIGTLPLVIANLFFFSFGESFKDSNEILVVISFLLIGVLCGFLGVYFNENRKRAIEQKITQESIGKGRKNKNKKNKVKTK